ncbi:hypothetical protein L5515_013144 [Caenorhabditis briggsae]|uniref:Uncharacterized protein n=1 Tax=Caenorhabditis briggsae TaxID=6238 RepID=A0AAE9EAQ6_CAEBR|nr:hypothetical protein L5515_013144 [Caenorhabditis briggsae]
MSTCATQTDLDRLASLNFIISQFVNLFTALITFSASIFALKLLTFHSILENSTKLLLILNLAYAIIYQIFYSIEATTVIYKHFNLEHEQCEILKLEKSCAPINQILLGCSSGMIFCQTGLILERTIATFYKDYCRHHYLISSLITLIILVISSQIGRLVYWDDPLNAASLACFVFPKQSAQRSLIYFLCCTVVTMLNLTASIWLKRYNKKLEYQ